MLRRNVIVAGVTLGLAAALLGGYALIVHEEASANQCASTCYAAHSQCRVASKGSPACDGQLSRCLSGCGRK